MLDQRQGRILHSGTAQRSGCARLQAGLWGTAGLGLWGQISATVRERSAVQFLTCFCLLVQPGSHPPTEKHLLVYNLMVFVCCKSKLYEEHQYSLRSCFSGRAALLITAQLPQTAVSSGRVSTTSLHPGTGDVRWEWPFLNPAMAPGPLQHDPGFHALGREAKCFSW